MSPTKEFDLFIDESGKFYENSYDPDELADLSSDKSKKFPSQLGGVLVPVGELDDVTAEKILRRCHDRAGWPLPPVVHIKDLVEEAISNGRITRFRDGYNKLITELLLQLQERGWRPVLLINREGVSYGNMIQTYTNLVAELFLRICRQKQREGHKRVQLNLICSEVQLQIPVKRRMPEGFYLWRLRETEALAAVRHGYAPEAQKWRLGSVTVKRDDDSRALQICDIISHASHANFKWCNGDTKALFKKLLEDYRWTMSFTEQLDRIEQSIEDRSLGLALTSLAEMFIIEEDREAILSEAGVCLSRVIDELAEMATPVRDSQLSIPLNWLEQIINLRRDLELGKKVIKFMKEEVERPLCARLELRSAELDWFTYSLSRWALTVCNHSGALAEAKGEVAEIERLLPSLAGRWEHFTLLTEGLIARAVHQTDCFEFEKASREMRRIAERYEGLAKAFSDSYPELYPPSIRSDLRAKALGTWLQSEIMAGPSGSEDLARIRALSDSAITEFLDEDDRERQWQYRCQLETLYGNYNGALEFLARSLKAKPSHKAVAEIIAGLADEPVEQGFALMHWLRLGSAILLDDDDSQNGGGEFSEAFSAFSFYNNPWCNGQNDFYPAHNILRRLATIHGAQGRPRDAIQVLNTLRSLCLDDRYLIIDFILLAAQSEVTALLYEADPVAASKLLESQSEKEPGIIKLAASLHDKSHGNFQELARVAESFSSTVENLIQTGIREINSPQIVRKNLLDLGRMVRF